MARNVSWKCSRDVPGAEICRGGVSLRDGRRLAMFVNLESNLFVVDVVDKDEKGGVEIVRRKL